VGLFVSRGATNCSIRSNLPIRYAERIRPLAVGSSVLAVFGLLELGAFEMNASFIDEPVNRATGKIK
jgi:hypothetical protein